MIVQAGLCQTWLEPQIVGFLMHMLRYRFNVSNLDNKPVLETLFCMEFQMCHKSWKKNTIFLILASDIETKNRITVSLYSNL